MAIFSKKQDAKKSEAKAKVDSVSVDIDPSLTQSVSGEAAGGEPGIVAPAIVESSVIPSPVVESTVVAPTVVASTGGEDSRAASASAEASTSPDARPTPTVGMNVVAAAQAGDTGAAVMEPVDIEDIEPLDIDTPGDSGTPTFGIADAIQLMRSLPADPNIDLVVRVVRVTLGAVNVSIEEIMEDAVRKEKRIQDGIAVLEGEVAELEKQVYTRRCEIAAQEADLRETANVRERLYQADRYNGHRPPPTPPDAARVTQQQPKPADWNTPDHLLKG